MHLKILFSLNSISRKGKAAIRRQATEALVWAHENANPRRWHMYQYPVQMRTPVKARQIAMPACIRIKGEMGDH
jgi:hypothetical protein